MLKKEKTLDLPGIGKIILRKNKRSKKLRISVKHEYVLVTFPPLLGFRRAGAVVEENLGWIKKTQSKLPPKNTTDIKQLRKEAKKILPNRLEELAKEHGFTYNRVFLRNTSTRWGSCSSNDNINLSIRLARLPDNLRDYVILHELNHLRYPGHQKDFWDSLSELCGTNAKALQKELRKYSL